MNNLGKALAAAAIFTAGYFVGFYEMKYKTMELMITALADKKKDEEESQI